MPMKYKIRSSYKYCPVCAGRLINKPSAKLGHLTCRQCGFIFYQNSKPTSSAFIINSLGQVLLAKRAINPKKGYWDSPGGFLENGEAPLAGLNREIKEELGVRLKDIVL